MTDIWLPLNVSTQTQDTQNKEYEWTKQHMSDILKAIMPNRKARRDLKYGRTKYTQANKHTPTV